PLGATADQDRVGHHAAPAGELHATLLADRPDRTDQVLVQPHAAGDAMHHDAESLRTHGITSGKAHFVTRWLISLRRRATRRQGRLKADGGRDTIDFSPSG